ncbi:MAG: aldo/keto reductase [Thermoplasmata archaeon]|nr:aldo/keto reductase [Thermoplasmata archaeon]
MNPLAPANAPLGLPSLGVGVASAFHPLLTGEQDRVGRALIRRAVERGIRLFDCSAGGRTDEVERRWTAAREDGESSNIMVMTTLVGEPAMPEESGPGSMPKFPGAGGVFGLRVENWAQDVRDSVARATSRLGRSPVALGWIESHEVRTLGDPSVQHALRDLCANSGMMRRWGVRFDRRFPTSEELDTAIAAGPQAVALPLHLLNAGQGLELVDQVRRAGAGVVSTDPYAAGLLDGSRLRLNEGAVPGQPPLPTTLGRLNAEFKPVTQLAHLTRGHRRTLPQAALQFLWGTPGVDCAIVPLRDPNDLEVAVGSLAAAPLEDSERDVVVRRIPRRGGARGDPSIVDARLK